jgi:hypothetical protein
MIRVLDKSWMGAWVVLAGFYPNAAAISTASGPAKTRCQDQTVTAFRYSIAWATSPSASSGWTDSRATVK